MNQVCSTVTYLLAIHLLYLMFDRHWARCGDTVVKKEKKIAPVLMKLRI
jgi:hypothetical protein